MKQLFKKSFITNHPILWAFIVFIGVEISFFIIDKEEYLTDFRSDKMLFFIVLIFKLLIFVLLAFGLRKFSDVKLNGQN